MADVMKEDDDNKDLVGTEEYVIVEDDTSKAAKVEDEDDEDQEDERPVKASDENDEEREAIRERRRLEKIERKDRREKAISRDKVEMDFLRKRNDELERRMSAQEQRAHASDLNNYDAHIRAAADEAQMADRVIAKAVEVGNGADVTQAMKYRDQALQKIQQLNYAKQQAAQKAPVAPAVNGAAMDHAKEFLKENKWYDSMGRDEDSAIVLAIDQTLVRDGYNPDTEEYWDELRTRAKRRLPERFEAAKPAKEERSSRGGPNIGSGREHAPTSTRKEIYVSPDRKQALIEAGVWDDPVLRMKYVKRYAEYDRNNKS